MYISKFQLNNYKSFLRTAELQFQPGFNIVTGQNNVGKTSLLEALQLQNFSEDRSHRSLANATPATATVSRPWAYVTIAATRDEIQSAIGHARTHLSIPIARPPGGWPFPAGNNLENPGFPQELINWVFSHPTIEFAYKVSTDSVESLGPTTFELYESPQPENIAQRYVKVINGPNGLLIPDGLGNGSPYESDLSRQLYQDVFTSWIYRFHAERVVGVCAAGPRDMLDSNAQNLAEVLDNLQPNHRKFEKYQLLVRKVLPSIQQISVVQPDVTKREIRLWPHDPLTERTDLTISLGQSGTGIGQVLAILYVAFMFQEPRVLLIDEPQTYLHPGAVRKLIEVLKVEFPQHQYIVATHSPTVISATSPTAVIRVTQTEGVSNAENIDVQNLDDVRAYLSDIGARLSDVFGADNILWVEGPTEEECFPKIYQQVAREPLLGTTILGVRSTGDFEAKRKDVVKLVVELYRKLSTSTGLIPPAIGFVFDREERSANQLDDLRHITDRRARFLKRRLYENYLLHAEAIAAVMNSIEGFSEWDVAVDEVQKWLDSTGHDAKYTRVNQVDADLGEDWIIRVHGADILKDLFTKFSETRVSFSKTEHSVQLTKWLIDHEPEQLQEIADLLTELLSSEGD